MSKWFAGRWIVPAALSLALALALRLSAPVFAAAPTELFFSEYIEGSSNNKALEIYNGTGAAIDLTAGGYNVQMYFNGSTTAGLTIVLNGSVAAGDVFVLAHSLAIADILTQADQTNGAGWYNGDDAVVLRKGAIVIDSLGQIGFDPGTEWGSGLVSTADNTLRRQVGVCQGDTDTTDAFDPATTWDGYATNTVGGLGSHSVSCVAGNDAPTVSDVAPADGATDVLLDANLSITFSEAVNVGGAWLDVECAVTGNHTASGLVVTTANDTTFTIDPAADFVKGESCTATVVAAQVSDQNASPAQMTADYRWSFMAFEACTDPFTPIYDIQGSGLASPLVGQTVSTVGVVVGDFQENDGDLFNTDLDGFYIQASPGDGDPTTSDGIFVFGNNAVTVGDVVRVKGSVSEYFGLTEINLTALWPCGPGSGIVPTAVALTNAANFEQFEGMLVTFPDDLTISEYFDFDRYGEMVLTSERQFQPTAIYEPGSPAAVQLAADNALYRITLDDGRAVQNPNPAVHPNGQVFDLTNTFRGGDILQNVTGILDYRFDLYRIQPTTGAVYVPQNPRPAQPDAVGGQVRVASQNVLNYFLTIDVGNNICGPLLNQECRGADTPQEFDRQRAKILAALIGLDADVVGLIEVENTLSVDPLQDLVNGLNDALGAGTYARIDTGVIGGDAIRVGLIYKPGKVAPQGNYALLTSAVDPRFLDNKNRPTLAQTFAETSAGGRFTVVVNHLKSKGTDCLDVGDPDLGDGQGNCNITRTQAAAALVDWLATDPTGSGDPDFLIIGDLNAYDKEHPIVAIRNGADDVSATADDYADLIYQFQGEQAYSYVFDGQLGYLDTALAGASLAARVTGATVWHIDADEPDLLDYDMTFKQDAQDALYEPNAYRAADHDPVLIGLCVDDTAPLVMVAASPNSLWPPNHKLVDVAVTLNATDASPYSVALLNATSSQPDNGTGDGDTAGDVVTVDDYHFRLRAERSGGTTRVYTLTYRVTDQCGNFTDVAATVTVPANQGKGNVNAAGEADFPATIFLPALGN